MLCIYKYIMMNPFKSIMMGLQRGLGPAGGGGERTGEQDKRLRRGRCVWGACAKPWCGCEGVIKGFTNAARAMSRSLVKRGSAWNETAQPPTSRYLVPASFNAANRSLKSGLTAIGLLPFLVFEDHVPHHFEALDRWHGLPKRPIERSVVVETDDICHGLFRSSRLLMSTCSNASIWFSY